MKRSTPAARQPWTPAIVAVSLLMAATIAAFWSTLHAELVSWDDYFNIRDNVLIRGFADGHFAEMWRSFYMGVWQPLGWISFTIIHAFAGVESAAYHAVNLVLHALNVAVFFFVARRLLAAARREPPAQHTLGGAVAAALFGLHPLRVEAVAWATCQPYLLAGLFCLLSAWAYLRAAEVNARRGRWLVISVAAYILSLLSKSIAVPLPVVLLLLDIYPLRRLTWPSKKSKTASPLPTEFLFIEKIPFFMLAMGTAVVAGRATAGNAPLAQSLTLLDRLAISAYGSFFYVQKTLLPLDLIPYNRMPVPMQPLTSPFITAAIASLGLTVLVLLLRRRWPAGGIAWLAYLVILAPVIGLVQHGSQLAADRYSYLACMPFAILLGAGIERLPRGLPRYMGSASFALIAVVLGILTRAQVHIWDNTEALWRHDVTVDDGCSLAWGNIGSLLFMRKEYDEATAALQRSVKLDDRNDNAWAALGMVHAARGDNEAARTYYQRALDLEPKSTFALLGLARLALAAHDIHTAAELFERAEKVALTEAELAQARQGFADASMAQGMELIGDPLAPRPEHLAEAIELVGRATARFESAKSRGILCALLQSRGEPTDLQQAVAQGRRAVQLSPEYAAGYFVLAGALARSGQREEAVRMNGRALELLALSRDPRLRSRAEARLARAPDEWAAVSGQPSPGP